MQQLMKTEYIYLLILIHLIAISLKRLQNA